MLIKNSKGQVGETLTWIVATILVVVILMFFIFGSSILGSTKKIADYRNSISASASFEGDDIFLRKSIYTKNLVSSEVKKNFIDKRLSELDEDDKFRIDLNETEKEIYLRLIKK